MRPINSRCCSLSLLLFLLSAGCSGPSRLPADPVYRGLPVPPGVVYIGDSLWLDEAEIANIHWLEYLHHIRKDSAEAFYQTQLPDTASWQKLQVLPDSIDPYVSYYMRYPGFRYFPAVGISYAQVKQFCRWRSDHVNRLLRSAEYQRRYPVLRHVEMTVTYRLPTVQEWEYAAGAGHNLQHFPLGKTLPTSARTRRAFARKAQDSAVVACLRQVPHTQPVQRLVSVPYTVLEQAYVGPDSTLLRCPGLGHGLSEGTTRTEYIYANPPNGNHLYNMIGNVAELTATEGVAKGGAFSHSIRDITIRTNFVYDRPQAWLGFRCACTVRVRRKAAAP